MSDKDLEAHTSVGLDVRTLFVQLLDTQRVNRGNPPPVAVQYNCYCVATVNLLDDIFYGKRGTDIMSELRIYKA